MIKKKYSYFVAYNIYQDGGYNHCHQITETDYEINFDSGLDGLISHIKNTPGCLVIRPTMLPH